MIDKQRVIVFTRYPIPGETKTRLITALGEEGAADLHRQMTEHVVEILRGNTLRHRMSVEIRFGSAKGYRRSPRYPDPVGSGLHCRAGVPYAPGCEP